MRIAVVGGGPGGLYFSALAKQIDPRHEITVWERNAPDDTFGFGVVFSDETLGGIEHADTGVFQAMEREFARWDDIDVHYRGSVLTSGGHGFAAMSRQRLLGILQERCAQLGVRIRYRTEAPDPGRLAATHDLVVAPTGPTRRPAPPSLPPSGPAWRPGSANTSGSAPTWSSTRSSSTYWIPRWGSCRSTATPTAVTRAPSSWRPATMCGGAPGSPPGRGRRRAARRGAATRRPSRAIRDLCAEVLDGRAITGNNSRWVNFTTVRCGTWRHQATSCCSATRRTPRTSPSARAPSWPWRTRWRWWPACTSSRCRQPH